MLCDGLKSEGAGHGWTGDVWRNPVWGMGWLMVRGGQGGSGFFDDGWWSAGVRALGQFGGGEELGVATGAVARTQEVEEALLADGDGCRGGGLVGWGGCWLGGYDGLCVGCWL